MEALTAYIERVYFFKRNAFYFRYISTRIACAYVARQSFFRKEGAGIEGSTYAYANVNGRARARARKLNRFHNRVYNALDARA